MHSNVHFPMKDGFRFEEEGGQEGRGGGEKTCVVNLWVVILNFDFFCQAKKDEKSKKGRKEGKRKEKPVARQ